MTFDSWRITVERYDGAYLQVEIPTEQVRYFMGAGMSNEFASAAYLAYCDLWTRKDLDREEPAAVQQADTARARRDEAGAYPLPDSQPEFAQGEHADTHRRPSPRGA